VTDCLQGRRLATPAPHGDVSRETSPFFFALIWRGGWSACGFVVGAVVTVILTSTVTVMLALARAVTVVTVLVRVVTVVPASAVVVATVVFPVTAAILA